MGKTKIVYLKIVDIGVKERKKMKKRLISIAMSIVVFAALFGMMAPAQAQVYQVWGQVFNTDGVTPVDGVDVTVTDVNTTDSLSATTAGGGYYQTVFGPPATNPVNVGDILQINATYGLCLTNTTTVTATGVSPQTVNLTLQADTTPPAIQFIDPTPANNSVYTTDYINVSVDVTDPSGVDNVTVMLLWNETAYSMNETMYAFAEGKYYCNMTNLSYGEYIYWVQANDTCNNTGVSETRVVRLESQINFTIDFVTGYNMISLPINDASVSNASTLITKIGANCTEVSKWDKATQTWKAYASGQPPIFDFDIGAAEGCFVIMTNTTSVEFTGKGWESPLAISLVTGYNMIGIPVNDTSVTNASSLISKIGANCTEVSKWDKATQTWKAYAPGQPPIFDFDIGAAEGCFVIMAGPADVTFVGEPWHE